MDTLTLKNINHDIKNISVLTKHQLNFIKSKIDNPELFEIILSYNDVLKSYEDFILKNF